ncbi:MAG: hypothetical protein KAS96_05235 [Planctomycetes bacterium]|nr:hypothetical protein [Planctomycetota bacterium]
MKIRAIMISLAVLVYIFFGFGCTVEQKTGTDSIKEINKNRLLTKIGKNYKNANAHYKLGKIYASEKQWQKALYEYDVALSFDPAHWQTQAAKLKALVNKGQSAKADVAAEMYINQNVGNIEGPLTLSKALEDEGLDKYVVRSYKSGIAKFPDSVELNRGLGMFYLKKDNKESARQYLIKSFELDPTQADVASELGKMGVILERPKPKPKKAKAKKK